MDKILLVVSSLLAISEVLVLIPSIKANGVFELLVLALKKIKNSTCFSK